AFIASAGGGGEITLLKDELRFGADLDLKVDSTKGPYVTEHFYAENHMNMLAGRVYAYARINYIIGSKEWHFDLWKWKGLQANGYIFNVSNTTYLIPGYNVASTGTTAPTTGTYSPAATSTAAPTTPAYGMAPTTGTPR